jgi:hypothetical protein
MYYPHSRLRGMLRCLANLCRISSQYGQRIKHGRWSACRLNLVIEFSISECSRSTRNIPQARYLPLPVFSRRSSSATGSCPARGVTLSSRPISPADRIRRATTILQIPRHRESRKCGQARVRTPADQIPVKLTAGEQPSGHALSFPTSPPPRTSPNFWESQDSIRLQPAIAVRLTLSFL